MTWLPYANGFEGVYRERENRYYIRWNGDDSGRNVVKSFRVDGDTKEKIIEGLENA